MVNARGKTKPDAVQRDSGARSFFGVLQARGHEPMLKGESGTLRFDVSGGPQVEHWFVTISDGNVAVSHRRTRADTVVRVDRDLFDRIAQGTANAMTAQLRGALVADGDLHLLLTFQRLFPGPPRRWSGGRPPAATGGGAANR
jgi:hypothetical protein